jgi:hypothetical protein
MTLPAAQKQDKGWLLPIVNLQPGLYQVKTRQGDKIQFVSFVKE